MKIWTLDTVSLQLHYTTHLALELLDQPNVKMTDISDFLFSIKIIESIKIIIAFVGMHINFSRGNKIIIYNFASHQPFSL